MRPRDEMLHILLDEDKGLDLVVGIPCVRWWDWLFFWRRRKVIARLEQLRCECCKRSLDWSERRHLTISGSVCLDCWRARKGHEGYE